MRQLMIMLFLLGIMVASGVCAEGGVASPARLANGSPIEDTIKETNTEGLVFQTSKGLVMFPWRYLSVGTRYRHERPFLAAQDTARSNDLQKAKAASVKAAAKAKAQAKIITDAKTISGKEAVRNLPALAGISNDVTVQAH